MIPIAPVLTDLESATLQALAVTAFAALAVLILDRERNAHRAVIFIVAGLLLVRYLHWRITDTLAPPGLTADFVFGAAFVGLEALVGLSSLSYFLMMSRSRQRSDEADAHGGWWASAPPPNVAVLIATYNEGLDVLERTLAGATALDYPAARVLLLDDGARPEVRALAERFGVIWVTRDSNEGAKAGNLNNALRRLAEDEAPPAFVAVLDADFVPHRDFLSRAVALMHDETVGLVQTPQHFFNADPIQHNLGLARAYPDEQRLFFDYLQPARDAWDIAICCGTSSVIRFDALRDIGFFPTDSVTEDYLLTLALQAQGWRTVYLNEAVTEGLAPEGLAEYITQRVRWCEGLMQILRGPYGPFGTRARRFRDRWSTFDAGLYWTAQFPFRLAAILMPLLYWFFGIVVVDAAVSDVVRYFGTYFAFVLIALTWITRGVAISMLIDVSQLVAAWPITKAALSSLLDPSSRQFAVTPKGGDRDSIRVQWALLAPFAILACLTVIGLVIGLVSWRFDFGAAGDGKVVVLAWSLYNLIVLLLTILVCVERPRHERHVADPPERLMIDPGSGAEPVWLWARALTSETVELRGLYDFSVGDTVVVSIPEVGEVAGTAVQRSEDRTLIRLQASVSQRLALLRRLHGTGGQPGVISASLEPVIDDLATGQ